MPKGTEQSTQNDILEGNLVKHKHSEKHKFRFLNSAFFAPGGTCVCHMHPV